MSSLSFVALKPIPGFCVKSAVLQDGSYTTSASSNSQDKFVLGESTSSRKTTAIPKGLKVFINIAWDPNVPKPPEGVELAIQDAFDGSGGADAWYLPVVISDGREDKDKAGKPALTFDAVFNSSLKSRSLKDSEFKLYIIELALQRIEAQTSLPLSRKISIPNIASKGKLDPRTVRIPHTVNQRKLIEELPSKTESDDSHQSNTPRATSKPVEAAATVPTLTSSPTLETPSWTWARKGDHILITIHVPKLTRSLIPSSSLDLETRRVLLHIPQLYCLDINLDLSNRDLAVSPHALTLKKMRNFDVDGAKAQWRVSEGSIVLTA